MSERQRAVLRWLAYKTKVDGAPDLGDREVRRIDNAVDHRDKRKRQGVYSTICSLQWRGLVAWSHESNWWRLTEAGVAMATGAGA